jgi:carbon storage regulator CsrA
MDGKGVASGHGLLKGLQMLVLTVKPGEDVAVGSAIVKVLSARNTQIKLGFIAPVDLPIHRANAKRKEPPCKPPTV